MEWTNARSRRFSFCRLSSLVAILGCFAAQSASAQMPPAPMVAPLDLTTADVKSPLLTLPGITPATCTNCAPVAPPMVTAHGLFQRHHLPAGAGCASGTCDTLCGSGGCGEGGCVAGRGACTTCEGEGRFGRLFCAFHNAMCCPDPCYEPRWTTQANAALFADSARPTTISRFRWDRGIGMNNPDRGEYFWAKTGAGGRGPAVNETRLNYDELSYYQEFAAGEKASFFIQTPYRSMNGEQNGGSGGFGDLVLGTKSMFLDSELLAMTFQFKTSIPTASTGTGRGTGHVSLEPSLLSTVKLHTDAYWQSQLAFTIPIAGTGGTVGTVLHYHNSINAVLCRPIADSVLVGMLEFNGYTFTSGGYTDPTTGATLNANGLTLLSVGPGLRFGFCDRIDMGFGVQFGLTSPKFADQLYRSELRWKF